MNIKSIEIIEKDYSEYNKGTIKLTFFQKENPHTGLQGNDNLWNGHHLWGEYEVHSRKEDIVFGVVHSIGDRMNSWAKENHYIAIREKDKAILGVLTREMGWHGSFGKKVSDWKKEIIEKEENNHE